MAKSKIRVQIIAAGEKFASEAIALLSPLADARIETSFPLAGGPAAAETNFDFILADPSLPTGEERFRVVAELASDYIYEFNLETKNLEWFGDVDRLFGYEPGGFPRLLENTVNTIHPDDRQRVFQSIREHIIDGKAFTEEYRVRKKDGSSLWISSRARAIKDEQGRLRRWIGVNTDVTESRRARQAMAESEERHRLLFETMLQGVVYLDREGRVADANPAAGRIIGLEPAKIFNADLGEIWLGAVREDGKAFPARENPAIASLRSGQPVKGVVMGLPGNPEEGRTRWIKVDSVPLFREGESSPHQVYITFDDITEEKQAREKLELSEERFHIAAELANDYIYEWNWKNLSLNWSNDVDSLFGFEPGGFPRTLQGTNRLVHPEDRPRMLAAVRRHVEEGVPFKEVYRVRKKDGSYLWISSRARAIKDERGIVLRWVGVNTDITEMKKAGEALRQSEARYRGLLDIAPVGIIMHCEGVIVFANPAAVKLLGGGGAEDIVGRSAAEIVHPSEMAVAAERLKRMIAGEKGAYPAEAVFLKLDGEPINLEVMATPMTHEGRPAVQVIMRDITDRKRAEAALRETEERYRALFDRSRDMVYLIDLNGRLIDGNDACFDLLGYKKADFTSAALSEVLAGPEELERAKATIEEVLRRGQQEMKEFRLKTRDGRVVELETVNALIYRDGQPYAFQGIARDITERRRLERELEEYRGRLENLVKERTRELTRAQEDLVRKERLAALGQLAGSIGHELLNPMGVINNSVYYLNLVLGEADEKVRRHLEMIGREVWRSKKIVVDLLDLTRAGPRQTARVDLGRLADEALDQTKPPPWLEVRRSYAAGLPAVEADPDQLRHIFGNIIQNAVQALEGREIERRLDIETAADNGAVMVRFRDSGPGIAPELMEKIFEPLVSTKAHGFGLGLAVSRQLARVNRGEVEAGNAPGGGAVFTVRFSGVPAEEKK